MSGFFSCWLRTGRRERAEALSSVCATRSSSAEASRRLRAARLLARIANGFQMLPSRLPGNACPFQLPLHEGATPFPAGQRRSGHCSAPTDPGHPLGLTECQPHPHFCSRFSFLIPERTCNQRWPPFPSVP